MKRFTNGGRRSLSQGNLYSALTLALTLPDICGSLEDPGPNKSKKRYIAWCKANLEPRYTHLIGSPPRENTFLSAEECYRLRCSLIHSGTADMGATAIDRIERAEFFDETTGAHCNVTRNFLQLSASKFSRTMFDAVDDWDKSVAENALVQAEKSRLLIIHSSGAVIDGIKFV